MVLNKKWHFFQVFIYGKIGIGIKKTPFYAIKTKSSNSRKIDISQKGLTDGFGPFYQLFYLGNIGQENVFNDILERKNACLGYKNKKLKKSQKLRFFQTD